jgi:hypothetical protein
MYVFLSEAFHKAADPSWRGRRDAAPAIGLPFLAGGGVECRQEMNGGDASGGSVGNGLRLRFDAGVVWAMQVIRRSLDSDSVIPNIMESRDAP